MGWYGDYKPYVPVAKRRAQAAKEVAKRAKHGQAVNPVSILGRKIAATFWGNAWCDNLEGYSDFENRLPRGRTYVRNGSVVHLEVDRGRIKALVSGSELYEIEIDIDPITKSRWNTLKQQCAGKIGSLVELLQGKLSNAVMERVTNRDEGLFPKPKEIHMNCSCPDYAGMCKHVAAVMYGVGNRLDSAPELLFKLRGVDHSELIDQAIITKPIGTGGKARKIAAADLGDIFGIEIDEIPAAKPKTPTRKPKTPETLTPPAAKVKTVSKPSKSRETPKTPPQTAAKSKVKTVSKTSKSRS